MSVVMAAYKAAETLEVAVRSVQAQTEQDFELIIVDDGSTDGTAALMAELASGDTRIRPIYLERNRGNPFALNRGTDAARGRWIANIDADDWYAPDRLQRMVDAGEKSDVTMVADNQFLYDFKASRVVGTGLPAGEGSRRMGLGEFLAATDPRASFDVGMLKPVFRADFIRKHRIEYREYARHGADYLVLLDFFVAGGQGLFLERPMYYYVQPYGSLSRQWAQSTRKRYPFEHMKELNDRVVGELRDVLQAQHLAVLKLRGRQIDGLVRFHEVLDHVRAREPVAALKGVATAPAAFWQLTARRGARYAARIGNRAWSR